MINVKCRNDDKINTHGTRDTTHNPTSPTPHMIKGEGGAIHYSLVQVSVSG